MTPTRRNFLRATAIAGIFSSLFPRTFAAEPKDDALKLALLSGSAEYHSDESLTAFAEDLQKNYRIACTKIFGKDGAGDPLPGIEAIDSTDALLVFTRRLRPPKEQLDIFKKYCDTGKPIIGLRTASHAFQDWLAFDKEVLGGNYTGHYGDGPPTQVAIVEKARQHPILAGIEPFTSISKLYKNTGLADDVELLLTGSIPDHTEPLAWTRLHKGGRVFYTSLGGPEDFKNPMFVRLLTNALFWTTQRDAGKLKK